MATKKISELEAITEADGSDVLAIVDVSEGKTNKITKNNLLKGSGHTIEMSLNENYQIVLKLKNAEGTELSTATIDLPNENAITNISYSNGTLTLTKQSGTTSQVDISGLINGLATETALTNLANALKETIGIDTTTYNESQTYNTGDIVVQNEKIYKANQDNITGTFDSSKWDEISLYEYQKLQDEQTAENYKVVTKLQEDVEDLTERVEDAENNEITNTPTPATSHYLQDSADSRFRKFIPIGRTTQESTTGKNLANVPENWSFTRYVAIPIDLEAGDYIISIKSGTNNGTTNTNIFIADDNNNRLGSFGFPKNSGEKNANITINSKATKLMCYSQYDYTSGENITATINQFMIRKASVTDDTYEPYTGGEPAPSPIYPFPIKNTGDNGSVNEKVSNSDGTQEQNISFPLAEGQKFYEGEELKENGKDDMWGEIVFDNTTNIYKEGEYNFYTDIIPDAKTNELCKCSHFNSKVRAVVQDYANCFISPTGRINMQDYKNFANYTAQEFKDFVIEQYAKGTPIKLVYKKANPTITPYTEEQQQYYDEHIKSLRTYKNITHISSEDETPANVEIEYVVDINTIDDRITALEAKVDLLEE